jgi:hypothetical protein
MANTFFVAIMATLISLVTSLLAAYAIQRLQFKTSGPTGSDQQAAGQGPQHRHGMVKLCPLSPYDRVRQHGFFTGDAQTVKG